jgi:hydrogenase maturation factor
MAKQKTKKKRKHKLEDKKLFLNYAMPCMVERVRRGEFTRKEFEKYCEDLVKEKEIPDEEMNNLFPVAMNFIDKSADKLDKVKEDEVTVDKEVVREYFWYDHDEVVKERMEHSRKDYCLVLPGKVKKVNGKEGLVQTPKGDREVSLVFLKEKNLKNKNVTIHYYHACEVISEEEFNNLWERKSSE